MERVGKKLSNRHYRKALFYLNKERINEAKKELYRALKYNPEHKEVRQLLKKYKHKRASEKGEKHYIIKSGDTLSDVAMKFYGTYKTRVYYPPVGKRIMISKILERHNNVTPEKLYVGQKIVLPELKGVPFIDQRRLPERRFPEPQPSEEKEESLPEEYMVVEDEDANTKTQETNTPGPPDEKPEVRRPKPAIKDKTIIPEEVKKGLMHYCKAEFYKAKETFRKYLDYEGNEEWVKIALAYLALVEYAYGNDDAVQKAIEKLLEIDPSMDIRDVSDIYPPFKEDLPPELTKRFKKIKLSHQ
jgi:tetratricopeptide (TPR) repeat protein